MKVLQTVASQATQDGDGVKISRVADFSGKGLDPYLMIDELKSDDEADYMGGFPPHPHRGIETFTYIIKGGFEHRDQMGNRKAIRGGDVQWMSTGFGVVHSEMPIADAKEGMHGFQIWLNMPAKDKLRPAKYQDSTEHPLPVLKQANGASLRLMAGEWSFADQHQSSPLTGLAGNAALADLTLPPGQETEIDVSAYEQAMVYIHSGSIQSPEVSSGHLLLVDPSEMLRIKGGYDGAGMLILTGNKIREDIVHMGPFVMNTQEQLHQAIRDYQTGKMGAIA